MTSIAAYFSLSKYVAVRAGAGGLAELGVVMAIANLLALVGDANVGQEILRRLAEVASNDRSAARELVSAGRRITAVLCTILMIALVILANTLRAAYGFSIGEVLLAGLAGVATVSAQHLLYAMSGSQRPVLVGVSAASRSLVVFGVFVGTEAIFHQSIAVSYSVGMMTGLCTLFVIGLFSRFPLMRGARRVPKATYRSLLRAGAGVTAAFASYGGLRMVLPAVLTVALGSTNAGLFVAAALVTTGCTNLITGPLFLMYFPRVAAVSGKAEADELVRNELLTATSTMAALAIALSPLMPLLLPLAFAGSLSNAAELTRWVLAAAIWQIFSSAIGFSLYGRYGIGSYLKNEVISGLSLVLTFILPLSLGAPARLLGPLYLGAHAIAGFLTWRLLARRRLPANIAAALAAATSVPVALSAIAGERVWASLACGALGLSVLGLAWHKGRARRLEGASRRPGNVPISVYSRLSADRTQWARTDRGSQVGGSDVWRAPVSAAVLASADGRSSIAKPTARADVRRQGENGRNARTVRRGRILGLLTVAGTATQLREAGSVGPVEILLVLYMLATWAPEFVVRTNRTARVLAVVSVGSALGALASMVLERRPLESALGGELSLVLLLLVTVYASSLPRRLTFLEAWSSWFGAGFLILSIWIFLADKVGIRGPFVPYFGGVRFQGWSSNPNQFSFFVEIALLAAVLSPSFTSRIKLSFFLISVVLSWASQSDGYRASLIAGGLILVSSTVFSASREVATSRRVLGAIMAALVVFFTLYWISAIESRVASVAQRGDQGSERIAVWSACWSSITRSPIVGLGPTGHGGTDTAGNYLSCHNTYLAIGASAGVLVALVFIGFLGTICWRLWRRGNIVTLALMSQLLVAMTFSDFFHYPQLWLLFCLIERRCFGPVRPPRVLSESTDKHAVGAPQPCA